MKKAAFIILVLIFGTPFVEIVMWLAGGMRGGWAAKAMMLFGLSPLILGAVYYAAKAGVSWLSALKRRL